MTTGIEEAIAVLRRENEDMRERLHVLERYVALSMSSSGATWTERHGLDFRDTPDDEVASMIKGITHRDPASLDKGG